MLTQNDRLAQATLLIFLVLLVAAAAFLPALPLFVALMVTLCAVLIVIAPQSMLALLLTLAPLRTLIATESGLALPLDIGQFLLLLYLVVWLAQRIVQRRTIFRFEPEPVLLSTLLLLAIFAIGAWNSASLSNWLTEWLKWVVIALMIWHLSLSASMSWSWLVFAVILSAVANALVGLYIFFGGSGADHLLILGRFFRAFGSFGQPNPFGGFMGIVFPISIMGGLSQLLLIWGSYRTGKKVEKRRVFALTAYLLASALIGAALLASWSRGAWLGVAVASAIMLISLPKKLLRGLMLAFAFAALIAGLWFAGLLPTSIVNRLTTAATDLITIQDVRGVDFDPSNYAVIERLAHWQAAIGMAQDKPIFGVGLGNYAQQYDDYRLLNWEEALGHAHNLYLNFLAEAGIVGLAGYLLFWAYIFRLTWEIRRHPDVFARCIGIGLLGSWTYIAVHSLFDNLYVNNIFLHIGVLLSILAILHRQCHQSLTLE